MHADRAELGQPRALRVLQVLHEARSGGHGGGPVAQAEPVERGDAEQALEHGRGSSGRERVRVDRGPHGTGRGIAPDGLVPGERLRMHDLARCERAQAIGERLPVRRSRLAGLPDQEVAGRQVGERRAQPTPGERDRRDPRVVLGVELRGVGHGARRDDADDLASHEPARGARILDLIADRDAVPGAHETRDVRIELRMREAAHRGDGVGAAPADGQRQLGDAARQLGVLEEHLVEIAHAEQQDRVRVVGLERPVLAEHRRQRGRGLEHRSAEYTTQAPRPRRAQSALDESLPSRI